MLILLSVIVIAFKDTTIFTNNNTNETSNNILFYLNVFFCIMFTVEFLIKCKREIFVFRCFYGYGHFFSKFKTYLPLPFSYIGLSYGLFQYYELMNHKIDCIILVCQWLYIIFTLADYNTYYHRNSTNFTVHRSSSSDYSNQIDYIYQWKPYHGFGGVFVFRCYRLVNWSSKIQMLINTFMFAVRDTGQYQIFPFIGRFQPKYFQNHALTILLNLSSLKCRCHIC